VRPRIRKFAMREPYLAGDIDETGREVKTERAKPKDSYEAVDILRRWKKCMRVSSVGN
jgi:hypothetical protein